MVVPALVAAGLYFGYRYFKKMERTQTHLEIIPYGKVHDVKLDGLTIKLDIQLKNPAGGSLAIQYPYVKVSYKGLPITSSQIINQQINVPAYGEAWIRNMELKIRFLDLISVAATMIAAIKKGEAVTITVTTLTEIILEGNRIPFDDTKNIPIKKESK